MNYDEITVARIKDDYDRLLDYYISKFKNKEMIYDVCMDTLAKYLRFRYINSTSCGAGRSYYAITSNGDIFSCAHFINDRQYRMASIYDLKSINASVIPVAKENLNECENCWVKNLCLGGCLAQKISEGKTNDNRMTNLSCLVEQLKWEFHIKLYYYAMTNNPTHFSRFDKLSKDPNICE